MSESGEGEKFNNEEIQPSKLAKPTHIEENGYQAISEDISSRAKLVKTEEAPMQKVPEKLQFKDVVIVLKKHLKVSEEHLKKFFKRELKMSLAGSNWHIELLPDNQAMVGKKRGKINISIRPLYKIGVRPVKTLNKKTKKPKTIYYPTEIKRLDASIPTGNKFMGAGPDCFEAGPGRHDADQ